MPINNGVISVTVVTEVDTCGRAQHNPLLWDLKGIQEATEVRMFG